VRSQDEDPLLRNVAGEALCLDASAAGSFPGKPGSGLEAVTLMESAVHVVSARKFALRPKKRHGRFDRTFLTFNHRIKLIDSECQEQQYAGTSGE